VKRRDALKSIGALAGAGAAARFLAGCGDNQAHRGTGGITTIVAVMMENRSYDHFLGARALEGLGGDGLAAGMSNPDGEGGTVEVYPETDFCIPDPPHGWNASRVQFGEGANDGFIQAYRESQGPVPPYVMGYFARDTLPFTWGIADAYASCDRWFSSVLGPTWPNRMYFHSGQSGGLSQNILPEQGGINWPSIHHRLSDAGVSWAYYYQDLPFVPLFKGVEIEGTIRRVSSDFFDDAAAGRLPSVCFVEPAFTANDDHPPHHPMLGQAFLRAVYGALAGSPQWENCLFLVTYDEAGGFFDHVPPPRAVDDRAEAGFDQLGFRVPVVVAGPYVKQGYVSSVVRDHTSLIAHLDRMFGLEPLTARSAAAEDLGELLDMERLAAGDPAPPADLPAVEIDESMIDDACYGARRAPGHTDIERLADAGFFAPALDRRGELRDSLHGIGEALDRLNAGRIRRRR
jgi:phospholipase C